MAIEKTTLGRYLSDPAFMTEQVQKLAPQQMYQWFDDFDDPTLAEADAVYTLNSGSDAAAIDPAFNSQKGGVLRLAAGAGDGTVAVDGSQAVHDIPVQASYGNLAFECRLKIVDVSECAVYIGFTDSASLEEPFSVSGTTITSTCTDGCGFVYDPAMTTDAWWAVGVDDDTDATGSGTTGISPADATYQTLRCEVSSDGQTGYFYINNALVKTLTANVVDPATNVYFTMFANGTGSNAAVAYVDIDYIVVEHSR